MTAYAQWKLAREESRREYRKHYHDKIEHDFLCPFEEENSIPAKGCIGCEVVALRSGATYGETQAERELAMNAMVELLIMINARVSDVSRAIGGSTVQ